MLAFADGAFPNMQMSRAIHNPFISSAEHFSRHLAANQIHKNKPACICCLFLWSQIAFPSSIAQLAAAIKIAAYPSAGHVYGRTAVDIYLSFYSKSAAVDRAFNRPSCDQHIAVALHTA